MSIDLVLLLILTIFVVMGIFRGGIAAGGGLFSLIFAYAGGVWAASHGAGALARQLGVPSFFAAPLAGTMGFLGAFVIAAILAGFARRWDRARREEETGRSGLDRFFGAVFGGLRGALVVLLLSYLSIWLDAARDLGVIEQAGFVPEVENSRIARITEGVVEKVVEAGLGDAEGGASSEARLIARLASTPGTALRGLKDLLEDERIGELQRDGLFWVLIENGASERALNRATFYRISHDRELRERLADVGLISAAAVEDTEAFRDEAMAVLEEVGPRLKGLREDPELQRLAQNPEIMNLVESGDTLALLRRPEFQRLVERLSSTP